MSREFSKLEVTSRLVDFGSSVVQLAQVTRAGVIVRHPLRSFGVAFVIAAAALIAAGMRDGLHMPFPPKPSLELWAACGLGGIGVFMIAYASRRLTIVTADGMRIVLPFVDQQFAMAVLECLREAIEAPEAHHHFRIDMAAKVITPMTRAEAPPIAARPLLPVEAPAAREPAVIPTPADIRAAIPARDPASGTGHPMASNGSARRLSDFPFPAPSSRDAAPAGFGSSPPAPVTNGAFGHDWREVHSTPAHGPPGYQNGASPPGTLEQDLIRRIESLPASIQPASNGMAAPLQPMGMPGPQARRDPISVPYQPVATDSGLGDLRNLMRFITLGSLQHKEALLDLLRVVEDHKLGGPTTREDADAHWQSFAEYVQEYLTSYDGLPELTARTGRHLAQAPRF